MMACFRTSVFLSFACLAALASPVRRQSQPTSVYNLPGDPTYSVAESDLNAALNCPSGRSNPNTVLLVPGTGTATVDFYSTNYGRLLPTNGFPVCYLIIPGLSLRDAQITSEYVAYGVNSLASTTGGPVRVLTHSQGGLNMQWALTFFPSVRKNTFAFAAMAPDYRGTILGPLVIAAQELVSDGKAIAAVLQQLPNSAFVSALASHGGLTALTPTTNIYTLTDDVVQPEVGPGATSVLAGSAENALIQSICPLRADEHFTIILDSITQFLVLRAFSSKDGRASVSMITAEQRATLCANALPQFTGVDAVLAFGTSSLVAALGTAVVGSPGSYVASEPTLMSYAR